MATRAFIGTTVGVTDAVKKTYTPNEVKFIYCHHGHPSDIGSILLSQYDSESDVNRLIDGGDMSSIDEKEVDYYNGKEGEEWESVKPQIESGVDIIIENAAGDFVDFVYLWSPKDNWQVSCAWGEYSQFDLMPLKEAIDMIAADKEGRW